MILTLIGIGTGNPDHLTRQAERAINAQDLILIPRKGAGKDDLAGLRRAICEAVITREGVRLAEFDLPTRDPATADYRQRVEDWHDAIAEVWAETIAAHPGAERAGLLVWGDPSLYDSTLRIAARLSPAPRIEVVPGITSLQALTAAHAIPLNEIGAPFQVTTGRRLRAEGWPPGVATVAVMLDGGCAFEVLPGADYDIWWGAYVGMAEEITCAGRLDQVAGRIAEMRAEARAAHGWIMDIYVLRRR
jgi:precorrin-6A synthase